MAAIAAMLFAPCAPADAEDATRLARTVTVSATGSIEVRPDTASVSSGVQTEAPTAREALARNNAEMAKVVDGLKAAGIQSKDIQTSALQLNPQYDASSTKTGSAPHIVGYHAFNQVRVTLRDVAKVGEVLDQLVELGANRINGISFGVSGEEALRDDARKAAMANARRRAELYAAAEKVTLGQVVTISESVDYSGPVLAHAVGVPAGAKFAAMAPIEPGQQRLEVTVYVTYELK